MGYTLSTLEYCELYLFSDEAELKKNKVPVIFQERIVRIRDTYNQWLRNPSKSSNHFVNHIKSVYNVSHNSALEDIRIIKVLLGNLNQSTKDFHRWKALNMIEKTFQKAENRSDTRGMAAAVAAYIKATNLDKVDENSIDTSAVQVQPFDVSDNPEVLGLKRVDNLSDKIKAMEKKYSNEIQDVKYEEVDLNA